MTVDFARPQGSPRAPSWCKESSRRASTGVMARQADGRPIRGIGEVP
jgi:hypothetical protein